MKIEIAELGRMTQSGSSLLRLIQNNKTPVLDLLVRESVQNSLDAHKADARSVTVEYLTGTFSSGRLGKELEGITDALTNRYPGDNCSYLAVGDSNTVGLTGEMDGQKVKDNKYGNLLKLIYEICKPQETAGAGGSWGLGKTVYFRIGIGLVIYYSRIDEGNGKYSSRLAASFVEDEMDPDAMIPEYNGMARRGIAWWGESIRENTTVPVTDETYIRNFLDIFGISPYTGDKTGTMIIIPYINKDTLLANNRIDYTDVMDEHLSPFWYSSLENYLRIAVQRWYAPRLCNPSYPYGAFLKVLINGKGISSDDMEPVFKTVQDLYNRANHVEQDDFLQSNETDVTVGDVRINKILRDTIAGNVACAKLTRQALKMDVPHNKPEPAVYFNLDVTDKATNRPVIFYVRKPGMIVSYETVSSWTAGIPSTSKNEFIFGIFVLNSSDRFKDEDAPVDSLEEYVRKSEMADHTSWNDWTSSHFNPRIISKIQASVAKCISKQYADDNNGHQPKENSELSRYLGDLILPPDGFGGAANPPSRKDPKDSEKKGQKKFTFSVVVPEIQYRADNMIVPVELKTPSNKKIRQTAFEVKIAAESGKIGLNEWQDKLKLAVPFTIDRINVEIEAVDGKKPEMQLHVTAGSPEATYEDMRFALRMTGQGTPCGLDIIAAEEHSMRIWFTVIIRLAQKNVRPAFVFEKEAT